MEEIEINGETYIKKSDVEKEYVKKDQQEHANNFAPAIKLHDGPKIMDPANISCLGTCMIGNGYVYTRLSMDYLKRAVDIMELIYNSSNSESVCLAWGKGFPAVIGKIDKEGKNVLGVIIAPRRSDDDE